MRKEYIVSMSPKERKIHEKTLCEIHQHFMEQGYKLEGDERRKMWDKTRALNDVIEIFKET